MSDDAHSPHPRKFQRQRTLKGGRLDCGGTLSFDVLIRDMSEGGVKLKLASPFVVPPTFELTIFNPNTGIVERRACVLRWQRGDLLGAQFTAPQATDALPSVEASGLRRPSRPV